MDVLDLPHSDTGPRDALPVVLLHGFPLDHRMWVAQKDALAAAGMRVIVPDLRGMGKAPLGRGPVASMAAMAADVLRMMDRAGLPRFALGGFSMGGYVAFEILRSAPQRVAGLALVATRPEPEPEENRPTRLATAEQVRAEGVGMLAESMLPRMLTPQAPQELRARVEAIILSMPAEGSAQALLGIRDRADARPLLPRVRVPTLVVVGDQDPVTPPETARSMAAAVPGAKLLVVPGAAHLSPMERPAAVSEALVGWARSLR